MPCHNYCLHLYAAVNRLAFFPTKRIWSNITKYCNLTPTTSDPNGSNNAYSYIGQGGTLSKKSLKKSVCIFYKKVLFLEHIVVQDTIILWYLMSFFNKWN